MNENAPVIVEELVAFMEEQCSRYYAAFQGLSQAAKLHFESRLWQVQRSTNAKRLDLADESIEACKAQINPLLAGQHNANQTWEAIKQLAKQRAAGVPQPIHESFLLSVEQALYPTVSPKTNSHEKHGPPYKMSTELVHLQGKFPFQELCTAIINTAGFTLPHQDLLKNVDLLRLNLEKVVAQGKVQVTLFPELFYRNQHAYLVGIIKQGSKETPLTIAFINTEQGIKADAVFFTEAAMIRIFEFTRSYFLVSTQNPEGLIAFLLRVMPHKRAEQLILNLGYKEWGKLLVRYNFNKHLQNSGQKLAHAPGIRGMVMLVFTLPDYPMVFKIIKNDIPPPKTANRKQVIEKYYLVAHHDRVGRMADAQLFSHWAFPVNAFDPTLLADLLTLGKPYVTVNEHEVVFTQLFTERKMTPLNIFLDNATEQEAHKLVIDYGNAIKEMAMSNIFPGDLLLKNFGVTPDLRVVFYDYDEVALLTECNFKRMPQPRYEEELWDDETWMVVRENDVFPEEFEKFMLPAGPYRQLFREHHGDIFDIHFWNKWKAFYQNNGFIDLQPY